MGPKGIAPPTPSNASNSTVTTSEALSQRNTKGAFSLPHIEETGSIRNTQTG